MTNNTDQQPGRESPRGAVTVGLAADGDASARRYAREVISEIEADLLERVRRIAESGVPLPDPDELAGLLRANLPDTPDDLDPHLVDVAPFYTSEGALRQLAGISKQALDSRRRSGSVLAMQTTGGTWLYPAWQFTGDGAVHPALVPVLRALRGMDRWQAGVWMVSEHPDLGGRTPRQALRAGAETAMVAALAAHDKSQLTA